MQTVNKTSKKGLKGFQKHLDVITWDIQNNSAALLKKNLLRKQDLLTGKKNKQTFTQKSQFPGVLATVKQCKSRMIRDCSVEQPANATQNSQLSRRKTREWV